MFLCWHPWEPAGASQDKLRKGVIYCQGSSLKCTHLLTAVTFHAAIVGMFCNRFGIMQLNEIYSQQGQKVVIKWPRHPFFDATNGRKNRCPVVKMSTVNSSQQPAHICVLLERILDFNGLLESAAQSRLPPLNTGQIDFGHIYCSLSIQFADRSTYISCADFKIASEIKKINLKKGPVWDF